MLAKWIAHATVDLDLSCFMLVLQKEARKESSMCDPFCENPAFLARAVLTLLGTDQICHPVAAIVINPILIVP